jgi:flagellar basal-body rod protein FlgG
MQESMFTGLFAALTAEHRMNNIANNLANVGTSGYKRDVLAFKDTMIQFAHDQIMEPILTVRSKPLFPEPQLAARVRLAVAETDYSQGSMQVTGNPLDVAIAGDGFFRYQTPRGDFLSRNGSFVLDAEGQIKTKQGWPVLSESGGPITIPPGARNIHIDFEGRVFADGLEAGRLAVVTAHDKTNLEKLGGNMYRPRPDTNVDELADAYANGALINQGYLEAANVDVVPEMVAMIETHRFFEATQKIMQSSDAVDREVISKVGRAR